MSNDLKDYQVGRDSDDFATGLIVVLVIVLLVIAAIVMFIFGAGAIVGGFYSLKNYFIAFKENVIDSNRTTATAV